MHTLPQKSLNTSAPTTTKQPITTNLPITNKLADLQKQENLLKSLKKDKLQGDFGELKVNLKWSTLDDLDLHIIDPANNEIYFSKKDAICQNSKGELDVDANAGGGDTRSPQENIFWKNNPPTGTYKIYVNHYRQNESKEVPFVVSIFFKESFKVIHSQVHIDNCKTMFIAEIKFNRNTGIFEVLEKNVVKPIK